MFGFSRLYTMKIHYGMCEAPIIDRNTVKMCETATKSELYKHNLLVKTQCVLYNIYINSSARSE